ncbi:MAG TPA: hypothetical protein VJZ26_00890 [Blastocatellia bacterium]|nr:hypothetical protein [Blastocatellia bacterium]
MLCPICAGEYQTRLEDCPGCGCGLVPGTFDERTVAEIEAIAGRDPEYVELCRPRLYPVAMLIQQMLEQNSVDVIIQGGYSLSVMPHLAYIGELRVLVEKEQLEFARSLYTAYFESNEEIDYQTED